MKINQYTEIHGDKLHLVPYEGQHVPKYHGWMQDPEMQILTASEPLTLEQEYNMQRSWRDDDNKCTFIVLDVDLWKQTKSEQDAMVGDVNLFLNDAEDVHSAEIEIMIAEKASRGKGLGREALLLMMSYGIEKLGMQKYVAKIGIANSPSLALFQKIGFQEVSRSVAFQEVTLELPINQEVQGTIQTHTHFMQICSREQ